MAASSLLVAETILEQLGGRRFLAMTGAKNLTGSPDSLSFSLPARFAKDGINKIAIQLEPSDTYTVRAYRIKVRGEWGFAPIAEREGVYAENLREVFRTITGLEVKL